MYIWPVLRAHTGVPIASIIIIMLIGVYTYSTICSYRGDSMTSIIAR